MALVLRRTTGVCRPLARRFATEVDANVKKSEVFLPKKAGRDPHNEIGKWNSISFFLGIPVCILTRIYEKMDESHGKRPEFRPYSHIRIRKKAFPWEGGEEKTLFYCPITNAGSQGYLDMTPEEEIKWSKYMHGH
ncbi:cytochrome c oxidase subunit 6A2, mitochondrial-like [Saccostrea cucullata]|uniref:cytochrome c oxidase subunit 6A2, mitochondrial-like n=1 Tax=Saccostrea cuccullata TaxID=36930 RepID=UPI002ED07022